MNGALVGLGMVVVFIAVASVVAYRINVNYDPDGSVRGEAFARDQSSLNKDLRDILAFVPLNEVNAILQSFLKHDKQIGDLTVSYINDNTKYIAREFEQMPEFRRFLSFLTSQGLDLEYWRKRVLEFWKHVPQYVKADASIACGGLTVMINKIMTTIPKEEMHQLLCRKVRYSASFKALIDHLSSENIDYLCEAIARNKVLQRHYFWANDDGIEVIFAIELLWKLYAYLVYRLY